MFVSFGKIAHPHHRDDSSVRRTKERLRRTEESTYGWVHMYLDVRMKNRRSTLFPSGENGRLRELNPGPLPP
eukprot:7078336-Ditylum_brightwellii.AAC.1